MERNYSDAVTALNSLQTNHSIIQAIKKAGLDKNKQAIPEMVEWCRRTGYEPSEFNRLKPIHIAGTKGKGSTSAFISSILGQYLPSPSQRSPIFQKIGLYTSPHLRFVRERIQINNEPLSEPQFAKYFFEVWDRLEASAAAARLPNSPCAKPVYFRFLTLVALHTYMSEGVDTAIIECGIGGEYDSTNILRAPTVTGITSLGIDHVAALGDTIESIAWHKAGIMKAPALAFTIPQPVAAMAVLGERAAEKGVELHVIERHPRLEGIKLGLAADFQKTNASLAIAIVGAHLKALGHTDIVTDPTPSEFVRGLEQVKWGGRCETRREGPLTWYLDGAHTFESITVAGEWFASCCFPTSPTLAPVFLDSHPRQQEQKPPRILLFNQQTRDANPLLSTLHSLVSRLLITRYPFTHAIFCSNITTAGQGFRPDMINQNQSEQEIKRLDVQVRLAERWGELQEAAAARKIEGKDEGVDGNLKGERDGSLDLEGKRGKDGHGHGYEYGMAWRERVWVCASIEEGIAKCREVIRNTSRRAVDGDEDVSEEKGKVLATGSVHLVGGVLEVLETETEKVD